MLRTHKAKARPNINKALGRRKIIKLGISRKIELFNCFASSSAHNIETSKVAAIFADEIFAEEC